MNESINVRTIQTLGNLKNAFIGFSAETQESLIAIENELRRTLDWLKGEADVRQRHVMRCRDEVDFAARALIECEAQEDDDYVPDCRAEIYELQEARRSLRHAEDELKIARVWFSKIQKAIQQFGTHVRRLKDLATDRIETAKAFLDRATNDLERYLGISTPTTRKVEVIQEKQEQDAIERAMQQKEMEHHAFRNLESKNQEIIEKARETDALSSPEVSGFEKSGVIKDNEVKVYLQDEFPPEHVRSERISEIRYTDKYVLYDEKQYEAGKWTKVNDKPSEICINRQVPEGSLDADELKETISHEVAHDVYNRFSEEEKQIWHQLSGSRDINECVDSYATTSEQEDFASTYSAYMHDPEYLRTINLDKYNYMRDHIFEGREYL